MSERQRESKKEYLQRKRAERSSRRRQLEVELDWRAKPASGSGHVESGTTEGASNGRSATAPITVAQRAAEHAERAQPLRPWATTVAPPDGGGRQLPIAAAAEVGWGPGGAAPLPERLKWEGLANNAAQLDALELEAFQKWEEKLQQLARASELELSWYEQRLGFWRQLWRVVERSHVLLLVCDARCPLYHLHPGLLAMLEVASRPVLLVLNKEDLTLPSATAAWREYLGQLCGPEVHVVSAQARTKPQVRGERAKENLEAARCIYSALLDVEVALPGEAGGADGVPAAATIADHIGCNAEELLRRVWGAHGAEVEERARDLLEAALGRDDGEDGAEHEEWDVKGTKQRRKEALRRKQGARQHHGRGGGQRAGRGAGATASAGRSNAPPAEKHRGESDSEPEGGGTDGKSDGESDDSQSDGELEEGLGMDGQPAPGEAHDAPHGTVVVGLLGEPNVGKSSVVNALLGAHKVAVSSHPGRTKHYQTHFVPGTPRLMMCDCPGIVFPRLGVGLPLQTLYGSFPIARCRNPYAVIRFLAERIDPPLHQLLSLRLANTSEYEDDEERQSESAAADAAGRDPREAWSPLAICEALAYRNKWRNKRGGRLDIFRAANWLLRSALAGQNRIVLGFWPPEQLPELDSVLAEWTP